MSRYSKAEVAQIEADLAYWQEIERIIPNWHVYGWTRRRSVSIETGDGSSIQLTGKQRDDIVEAFKRRDVPAG